MKKLLLPAFIFLALQGLISQPGTIDLSFNPDDIGFGQGDGPDSWVFAIAEQSDGKILIGGDFKTYNGFVRGHVARIHSDGTLDQTFDAGNLFTTFYATAIRSIISLENGKVMIGCDRIQLLNDTLKSLHRLHADGTIDDSFIIGNGPDKSVFAINELSDGKVLIGGYFDNFNGIPVKKIARLHPDGSLDHTFQGPDFTAGYVTKMLLLPDNKIMVIGYLFLKAVKVIMF
jgi:uncharacterized delta-60 repeat protein